MNARSTNEITEEADRVDATGILPALGKSDPAGGTGESLESRLAALRSVAVAAAVVVVSLLLGYLTGAGVASALLTTPLFCLVVFGALAWASWRPASFSEQAAGPEARRHDGWRILLIAGGTPTIEQLQVLRIAGPRAILDVHAPVLRGQLLAADTGREIELARNRLRTTLTRAERAGIDAIGELGDPSDPLAGIEDQLRRHHIDEVIVATGPLSHGNPLESELLRQLRSQLDKPLTHVETR